MEIAFLGTDEKLFLLQIAKPYRCVYYRLENLEANRWEFTFYCWIELIILW